jgi:hypothetical protein
MISRTSRAPCVVVALLLSACARGSGDTRTDQDTLERRARYVSGGTAFHDRYGPPL